MKWLPILVFVFPLVLRTNAASLEQNPDSGTLLKSAVEPEVKTRVKRQVCKDDPDCWDPLFPWGRYLGGSITRGVRPTGIQKPCKNDPFCTDPPFTYPWRGFVSEEDSWNGLRFRRILTDRECGCPSLPDPVCGKYKSSGRFGTSKRTFQNYCVLECQPNYKDGYLKFFHWGKCTVWG